jgi:hypothetical protein
VRAVELPSELRGPQMEMPGRGFIFRMAHRIRIPLWIRLQGISMIAVLAMIGLPVSATGVTIYADSGNTE